MFARIAAAALLFLVIFRVVVAIALQFESEQAASREDVDAVIAGGLPQRRPTL